MTPKERYDANLNHWTDMWDYSPWLLEHARGDILEIGVQNGVSTSAFLLGVERNGGHLYSVDINPKCGALSMFEGHPDWTFILSDSREREAVSAKLPPLLDILFIDGNHSYPFVSSDLCYSDRVRPGGLVLMHDVAPEVSTETTRGYGWEWGDPRRAYDEFVARTGWQAEILPGKFGLGVIKRSL